jgi:hypothetical protein
VEIFSPPIDLFRSILLKMGLGEQATMHDVMALQVFKKAGF